MDKLERTIVKLTINNTIIWVPEEGYIGDEENPIACDIYQAHIDGINPIPLIYLKFMPGESEESDTAQVIFGMSNIYSYDHADNPLGKAIDGQLKTPKYILSKILSLFDVKETKK